MNGSKSNDERHLKKDAGEKEENHLDRILRSHASRRLFPWAAAGARGLASEWRSQELQEQQRLRWNFDFLSETPLPGRYQWVRVDRRPAGGGASRDAADGPPSQTGAMRNGASIGGERRSSRQNLNSSPYFQKSTRRPRPGGDPLPHGADSSCKRARKLEEEKKST